MIGHKGPIRTGAVFSPAKISDLRTIKHFNHTWAKNLGNIGGDAPTTFTPEVSYGTEIADRYHLNWDRGNIAGTRRNRIVASAIYQLPFGKNRKFLNKMSSVGNAVLGGWEMSTVTTWETGP